MKIIKEGKQKVRWKVFIFECKKCNTEYECEGHEVVEEDVLDNQGICWNTWYYSKCPICGYRNHTVNKR